MTATQAPTPGPLSEPVYVEVSGLTGTGKSAVMGEIEIALKALGLPVEHGPDFQAEKNGTHADWLEALDLYKPVVVLCERNISRLAPTAPVEASGSEREAKCWVLQRNDFPFAVYGSKVAATVARDLKREEDRIWRNDNKHTADVKVFWNIYEADASAIPNAALRPQPSGFLATLTDEQRTAALAHTGGDTHPQPSGETREAVARINEAIGEAESGGRYDNCRDDGSVCEVMTDDLRGILALIRLAPVASGGQHSSANDFPPGEVTDEWAERFCEAVNWSPDGQECKAVEGQVRCVSFRDLAKGYILSAIATQPAITSATAPVAETAGEAVAADSQPLGDVLTSQDFEALITDARTPKWVNGDYTPTEAMVEAGLEHCRPGNHANMVESFMEMMKQAEIDGLITYASPVPAQDDDKLRIAASALLDACVKDFGDPADFEGDDGSVARSKSGGCAVTFKHMRDLNLALTAAQEGGQ